MRGATLTLTTLIALVLVSGVPNAKSEERTPLPSWNDGQAKRAIIEFVEKVTKQGSPTFVEPSERIATFDNDGTLWPEQPVYFQFLFAVDRIREMAPEHPEWRTEEPFASLLKGDMRAALADGEKAIVKTVLATHAGMTSEEFTAIVKRWISTAKHPVTKRLYTEMVYQPMLEVLRYLRENSFKTFIVSGGGAEFMRPWAESVCGIPPEQVIGSTLKTEVQDIGGSPQIVRLSEIGFINDKQGKVLGINYHIGRRPIAAFGNSDGDLQMLQWTTAGTPPRFGMIIHHTDDQREWRYDRQSKIGHLDEALDEAPSRGWNVVDMKSDWKVIYPSEKG